MAVTVCGAGSAKAVRAQDQPANSRDTANQGLVHGVVHIMIRVTFLRSKPRRNHSESP